MRHAPQRDASNGVLGQAFVLEAFHAAWVLLGNAAARDAGLMLLHRHSFNKDAGCWNRVDFRGNQLSPDLTFNHQLYFAATAALYASEDEVARVQVDEFLLGLRRSLVLREDGRVVHEVGGTAVPPNWRKRLTRSIKRISVDDGDQAKEADYHLYNAYAFSLLAQSRSDVVEKVGIGRWNSLANFIDSEEIRTLVSSESWSSPLRSGTETRVLDREFFRATFENRPPDFELTSAYLNHILGPDRTGAVLSPDPVTQKARTYRYWRLISAGHKSS